MVFFEKKEKIERERENPESLVCYTNKRLHLNHHSVILCMRLNTVMDM